MTLSLTCLHFIDSPEAGKNLPGGTQMSIQSLPKYDLQELADTLPDFGKIDGHSRDELLRELGRFERWAFFHGLILIRLHLMYTYSIH